MTVSINTALGYGECLGMDGDNWSQNNVRTGGAGAIGWRIPFDEIISSKIKEFENLK